MAARTKEKPVTERLKANEANGVETNLESVVPNVPVEKEEEIVIRPLNLQTLRVVIEGTAPLVTLRFGSKAQNMIEQAQRAGSIGKSKKQREPKDFEALYEDAKHISTEGWCGFPAMSIRHALIDACSISDIFKTIAKKTLFVEADGYGKADGAPLIKILGRDPHPTIGPVRNASGVIDLRARAMYDAGWRAEVRIQFDADRFSRGDVANLLARSGVQCGICEGRPNGKKSNGMGWGVFKLVM